MKFSPKAEVVRFVGEDVIATSGAVKAGNSYVTKGLELNQWYKANNNGSAGSYGDDSYYEFTALDNGGVNPGNPSATPIDGTYAWYNSTNDMGSEYYQKWFTGGKSVDDYTGGKLPAGYDKQF